jgi:hypothetical protein
MIVQIESFENIEKLPCEHDDCDGRPAKWKLPQTAHLPGGVVVCCSVHLPRFIIAVIGLPLVESHGVMVEAFENPRKLPCSLAKCDGRQAHWAFPQSKPLPAGKLRSCNLHIPAFAAVVERDFINRAHRSVRRRK